MLVNNNQGRAIFQVLLQQRSWVNKLNSLEMQSKSCWAGASAAPSLPCACMASSWQGRAIALIICMRTWGRRKIQLSWTIQHADTYRYIVQTHQDMYVSRLDPLGAMRTERLHGQTEESWSHFSQASVHVWLPGCQFVIMCELELE